jgi:hypothetical protein
MSCPQLMDTFPIHAQLVDVHDYSYGSWGGTSQRMTPVSDVVPLLPVSNDPDFSHKGEVACPRCGRLITIRLSHEPDPEAFRRHQKHQVGQTLLRLTFLALMLWWIWYSWPMLYLQSEAIIVVIQFGGLAAIFFLIALFVQTGERPWGRQMSCDPSSTPDLVRGQSHILCRHEARGWRENPGISVRPKPSEPAIP